jgi:outer membrane protein assembly factor BamB
LTCTPKWTSSVFAGRALTVTNGKVYAAGDGGVRVFDATGCNGGATCAPLWTTGTFYNVAQASPAVVDGVVYVSGSRSILATPGNAQLIAYDADGCGAAVCPPLWWSSAAPTDVLYSDAVAVAAGLAYVRAGDKVAAFDVHACATTTACTPIWTATPGTSLAWSGVAVSNGTAFVVGYGGKLYAIGAGGATLWSADVGDARNTPAVADGRAFVVNGAGIVRAFDANGVTSCSTGVQKVCTPLWTYTPNESGYVVSGSPAVANGVLYTVTPGANFRALNAATGARLWMANTGKISSSASPAIVDGTVYWNSNTVSTTWAYALPPAPG